MNVSAPVEIVTGPAAPPFSSSSRVPDIEIFPPALVAAISRSASFVKLSPPVAAAVPVPNEPYVNLREPDIDISPADAIDAANAIAVVVRRTFFILFPRV